jgi:hypothetical protein
VLPLQGATRRMQLQIELRGLRLIEVQAAMRTKVEMKQVGCCCAASDTALFQLHSLATLRMTGPLARCASHAESILPACLQEEILRMNDRTYRKFLRFNLRQRGDMLKVRLITQDDTDTLSCSPSCRSFLVHLCKLLHGDCWRRLLDYRQRRRRGRSVAPSVRPPSRHSARRCLTAPPQRRRPVAQR